ncbi:checkpoint clamp complex protein Rad1 [Ceratocystis pirilliformis]|uniref:Dolichyl-diphosphooligosaccharide-protein glycosyltransferase subunit OST5 n=1 Tax=Ceratocystis pirilliformis TaxID=259994 RepID=A0ABR3YSF2_9PEZI
MNASVQALWTASHGNPFAPALDKDSHFTVGFSLVLAATLLAGVFTLKRSIVNIPLLAIPSSAAFA